MCDQRSEMVLRIFSTGKLRQEWCSPAVLAAIDLSTVDRHVRELLRRHGPVLHARICDDVVVVTFADVNVPIRIAIGPDQLIHGLFFLLPTPQIKQLASLRSAFTSLPGNISVMARVGRQLVFDVSADLPLAVGSAYKLFVYRAVVRLTLKDKVAWDSVLRLSRLDRSVGGPLDIWPAGSPLTLDTLCKAMIAHSDNTAADRLLRLVGRSTLEGESPRNKPYLSSRQMLFLKMSHDLRMEFKDATLSKKRSLLRRCASAPIPEVGSAPYALDHGIEWHYTVRELCQVIYELSGHEALRLNPGPIQGGNWKWVAFKAGREPGVLNFTVAVPHGRDILTCSVTWNGSIRAPEAEIAELTNALLFSLAGGMRGDQH